MFRKQVNDSNSTLYLLPAPAYSTCCHFSTLLLSLDPPRPIIKNRNPRLLGLFMFLFELALDYHPESFWPLLTSGSQ